MQYSYIYPHSSGYWPEPNDHDAWWNSKRYMNAMTFPIARHWSDCWTIWQNNTKETSKSSQQALCEENPLSKRPITHKGFPLHEVIIILLVHIDLFVVECIAMMPYYKHARWYQWQVTLRIEPRSPRSFHNSDVIMNGMVSETTSVSTVYSTVCSGVDKKPTTKLRITGLCVCVYVGGWPVNSPRKGLVTRSLLPFDGVIMSSPILCWYIR